MASAFNELSALIGAREIFSIGLDATPLGRLQIGSEISSLRGLLGGARDDPLQEIMQGKISGLGILLCLGHRATVGTWY